MLRVKLFDGQSIPMIVYNGLPIIDEDIQFFTVECGEEIDYVFNGYVSSFLRVYNERLGILIKNIGLSQSVSSLIINASVLDMTFEDNGNYYYEMGYVQSGGYEVLLRYGLFQVV